MERVVLVRSKTGVFHHFEWWKRGIYHKITMIYSLEPVKNELKRVFLQPDHPREPPVTSIKRVGLPGAAENVGQILLKNR